jgi:hypothetical protein
MLFSLIAFSRTGKDTLYKNLKNLESLGWMVYAHPSERKLIFPTENASRIALADKLKIMVCELLGMDKVENPSTIHPLITVTTKMSSKEWIENGWIDTLKDVPSNEVNLELQGKTVRDWLIDYGWEKKIRYGMTYFVDLVKEDVNKYLSENINVFITDIRYPYEILEGTTTIRLFRSDVRIAEESVHSERSMDNYTCSFVFCKNNSDFEILKQLQPQYKDYICQGPLTALCTNYQTIRDT